MIRRSQTPADWLEIEGFEAALADTLEAAFILIAAEPLPEAVLLDIHLGSKNGLTLVHWRAGKDILRTCRSSPSRGCVFQRRQKCPGCGLRCVHHQTVDFKALREILATLRVHSVG